MLANQCMPMMLSLIITKQQDFFCNVILPGRQHQPGAVFQLCPVTQTQYVPFNSWVAEAWVLAYTYTWDAGVSHV